MENTQENKDLVIKLLNTFIREKEIMKLESTLLLEKELDLPRDILLEGHNLCGTYFLEGNEYLQAMPHLNKARSIVFVNKEISKKCFDALLGFYRLHENIFSVDDLNKMEATFIHFSKQVELHIPDPDFLKVIPGIIDEIKLRRLIAVDVIETTMTFRVENVFNAYYQPKTYNDVLENFAFAIEDDLRDFYDNEKNKSDEPEAKKEKQEKKKKEKPKDQE
jgi:hypothetical protein